MAIPIGTLGTIPTLQVGGQTYTDLTNLITLFGTCLDATNTFSGMIKQGGASTAYPVTTGKTLTISSVRVYIQNVSGGVPFCDMAQCDNALALNTASTPTNPLYFSSNSSSRFPLLLIPYGASSSIPDAGASNVFNISGKVASTKFTAFYGGGQATGVSVLAYGYEA